MQHLLSFLKLLENKLRKQKILLYKMQKLQKYKRKKKLLSKKSKEWVILNNQQSLYSSNVALKIKYQLLKKTRSLTKFSGRLKNLNLNQLLKLKFLEQESSCLIR
jgi:predicted DCC family thiol-disulfide oxidoreductase YuxK